jgi:hypothetical protein
LEEERGREKAKRECERGVRCLRGNGSGGLVGDAVGGTPALLETGERPVFFA